MIRTRSSHRGAGVLLGLALALGACAGSASADPPQQLYVAKSGDDANPGTSAEPFATLQRAQQEVRALAPTMRSDVVVNVRAGTYRLRAPLELGAADSGRDGHRVIWQADGYGTPGQADVTVSGGRRVTGWSEVAPDLWAAPVGGLQTRQLYVDGERAVRAELGGPLPGDVTRTRTGYVTTSAAPLAWERPQDVELVYTAAFAYAEPRCGVREIVPEGTGARIVMDQPCYRRARRIFVDPPEQRRLPLPTNVVNSPSFLRPGSWYLDRSTSGAHVVLYSGAARPQGAMAPKVEGLVRGDGVEDLTLRGLTFAYTTWLVPNRPAGFVHVYGSQYYLGGPAEPAGEVPDSSLHNIPAALSFRRSERVELERNRLTHLGGQGLEISSDSADNVVRGNELTDVSAGGMWVGSAVPVSEGTSVGDTVENNHVHAIGVDYRGGIAMVFEGAQQSTIAHNLVEHPPYTGISVLGTTEGMQVLSNRVVGASSVLNDGGGIYSFGTQGTSFSDGLVIRANVVTQTRDALGEDNQFVPIGIYTDWEGDWITVEGNVAWDNYRTFGGVFPRRIRFVGNFWDHELAGWYPPEEPADVTFADNTVLPRRGFEAECRAVPACAAILADAGLEPGFE
jgi:hypothetical protein